MSNLHIQSFQQAKLACLSFGRKEEIENYAANTQCFELSCCLTCYYLTCETFVHVQVLSLLA